MPGISDSSEAFDPQFRIEILSDKKHDRTGFSSGSPVLDNWFITQAGQQMRRKLTTVYVALELTSNRIVGYYTISAFSIKADSVQASLAKTMKLSRYPILPAILLGRLAVHEEFQGRGLGKSLLFSATQNALRVSESLGAVALIVDAKDKKAVEFYKHFGFHAFVEEPDRLLLPFLTISRL